MPALEARGHKVVERPPGTSDNSVLVAPDGLDCRRQPHARRAGGGVLSLAWVVRNAAGAQRLTRSSCFFHC